MEYKGNFLEEMIDKTKVNLYFEFFKRYNPLYAEVQLRKDLIDTFETEFMKVAENFEKSAVDSSLVSVSISEDEESNSDTDDDGFFDEHEIHESKEEEEKTFSEKYFFILLRKGLKIK